MSKLTAGVHTVDVVTRREVMTDRGPVVQEDGIPVTYKVNVQPVSTAEREALGVGVSTVYRIKYFPQAHGGKPWSGGPYSKIIWNGGTYEQLGDPLISSMSPRTGHVKVLMAAQQSEVR